LSLHIEEEEEEEGTLKSLNFQLSDLANKKIFEQTKEKMKNV
jgi:hypothetical protein